MKFCEKTKKQHMKLSQILKDAVAFIQIGNVFKSYQNRMNCNTSMHLLVLCRIEAAKPKGIYQGIFLAEYKPL